MSISELMPRRITGKLGWLTNLTRRMAVTALLALVLIAAVANAQPLELTIDKAREKALVFNRAYLAAQEEVTKAGGEVARARAGAFPTIEATGGYLHSFKIPKTFFEADGETQELQFGYANSFSAGLTVSQSLFQGGKVFAAYSIAKDYRKFSKAMADQSRSEVIYNAELLFYSALLQRSRLLVLEKALEANSYNLEVVEKQFSQGLVSEYEVLRARVEKNNLLPRILAVKSEVRLSEKRLKSFLGIEFNSDVTLREEAEDTSLQALPSLEEHFQMALEARPEIHQAEYMVDMRRKAIRVAQGDYYPSAGVFLSYDWQAGSDELSLRKNNSNSWTAGLSFTIPIFQGGARGGEVGISKADHRQAMLVREQLRDDVRLQVEEAYDLLTQAKETMDIQGANIAEAEAGLRISNLRYESGIGTLLEVLSAQVALTDARNAQAEAVFLFRQARSQLRIASTL
ncbi:MAG: TolC family protein [candidate division Zixibacteria bacterium]|nr:TolC family protein [candidate division Zixibacteria bacterium]